MGDKSTKVGWIHKHFMDPKTGKVHRIYTFNGKSCLRTLLESRLCDQLAGYAMIEKDLRSALVWVRTIEQMHDHKSLGDVQFYSATDREKYNLVKGLFVAALTFYGKCFSKCEGRPVKLERSQLRAEFRELHDTAISYRHNFAAHSGAAKLEEVKIALVTVERVKPGRGRPLEIFKELVQPDILWQEDEEGTGWIELFESVRQIALGKIELLTDKILKDEVLPFGPDHFFKQKGTRRDK